MAFNDEDNIANPLLTLSEEFGNTLLDDKLLNCVRFHESLNLIDTMRDKWQRIYVAFELESNKEFEQLTKTHLKHEFMKNLCKKIVDKNKNKPLKVKEFLEILCNIPLVEVVFEVIEKQKEILNELKNIVKPNEHALLLYKRESVNEIDLQNLKESLSRRSIEAHDFEPRANNNYYQADYVFILFDDALGRDFDEDVEDDSISMKYREYGRVLYMEHIEKLSQNATNRFHVFKINACKKIDYYWLQQYNREINLFNPVELDNFLNTLKT